MSEELKRKLSIGFMDKLSIKQRSTYIANGISIKDLCMLENQNYTYEKEANEVISWLEGSSDRKIIWSYNKDFPSFEGVERRLPYMLFVEGTFPETKELISVVGTRKPSYDGYKQAFILGYEVVANGMGLVSGLAEGCDQASSIGAVSANGRSYAVIGCGHNLNYPSLTIRLRKEIVEKGGGIISRFSPCTAPSKYTFPNRNLIIAAMSKATVIIQAPGRSGALITGDMALQLGKDLFVSSSGTKDVIQSRGSRLLFESGCPSIEHLYDIDEKFSYYLQDCKTGFIRFSDSHYILKNKE